MNQKTYNLVTGVVFLIIALLHLFRAILGWQAVIGTFVLPIWISWFGLLLAGYLAYQGLRNK